MTSRNLLPTPRLAGLVRAYFMVEEHHGEGMEEHRFLPEGFVRLTFTPGEAWWPTTGAGPLVRMPEAAITGMNLMPLHVVLRGNVRSLGV